MWQVIREERSDHVRFSVYENGVEIGYLAAHEMSHLRTAAISHLFVLDSWRKKGIGRALLEAAIQDYPNAKCVAEPYNTGMNGMNQKQLNNFYRSTGGRVDIRNVVTWGRFKK